MVARIRAFPHLTSDSFLFLPSLHVYHLVETGGSVCSNDVVGVESDGVCCDIGCGTCGGSGCAKRPGGGVSL